METSENLETQSVPNLPKVAVITPCYNGGHLIDDAINSVIDQTYDGPIELYIVDDSSTKNILNEITTDYLFRLGESKKSNSFKAGKILYNTQNEGPSWCRNHLAKQAIKDGCKYLAFLDADDIYHPDKIKKSVEILESDENIAAVYSDYSSLNMTTGVSIREYKPAYSKEYLLQECIINNDSVVRASVFQEVGGYLESIRRAEDWDLWLRISHKHLLWHIPEDLLTVRNTSEGLSNLNDSNREAWNYSWSIVRQRVEEVYKTGKIPMGSMNV